MSITVLNPGLLTTVQDLGRIGYQQFGVSVSGVMDPRSAGIANILAGNPQGEAVLECTMMGPQLQFDRANCIAIAGGDLGPTLDGKPIPSYQAVSIKAGPFEGPMVCSMRPMTPENAQKAYDITVKMPNVHGAPVHMGDPAQVGVADVMKPDYGEAVDIYEGEIPVFWPCGVTPQAAIENAKPPIVITHAPGHMFITDVLNTELNEFLERKKSGADQ